jgi:hypothetical protein
LAESARFTATLVVTLTLTPTYFTAPLLQVDFQHADLVQKRDIVLALRTGQQATVHKYRDAVTKLENLIESRRGRLTVSQESQQKELYLQLIKHVSMEPSNIVVPPENSNAESASTSTGASNKNFLQGELLSRDSFKPPEDEEDWQKYQSKWTRLVQSVADNVYEQAVSPTAQQCAVLERVVQGYQRHLGLKAGTAMEVDGGSGGTGDEELGSINKTTTTATATIANAMVTTTTGTLISEATSTGFMYDRDTGNTGPAEFTGMHPPMTNNDRLVDETGLLPMTAETTYAMPESVQE